MERLKNECAMVTDLNETEKSKRQASTDLATIEKIAKKPRNSLDDLTAPPRLRW